MEAWRTSVPIVPVVPIIPVVPIAPVVAIVPVVQIVPVVLIVSNVSMFQRTIDPLLASDKAQGACGSQGRASVPLAVFSLHALRFDVGLGVAGSSLVVHEVVVGLAEARTGGRGSSRFKAGGHVGAEALVACVHGDVDEVIDHDLHEEIDPRAVEQAGGVDEDGARVEGQEVGHPHERAAPLEEGILPRLRGQGGRAVGGAETVHEGLKLGRAALLAAAVVAVVVVEGAGPKSATTGQPGELLALVEATVELRPLATLEEEEVNLAVVVGERTLGGVAQEARHGTGGQGTDAPTGFETGKGLRPKAEDEGQIDSEKPHVARKSVEASADHGLLTRQARQLAVRGVAEVGQHQQHDAHEVVERVRVVEHPSRGQAEEDGDDGDGVGMDAQSLPDEGEEEADGAREMDVEPFLRVLRLHGCLQEVLEAAVSHIV